jgi:hypothetical protein
LRTSTCRSSNEWPYSPENNLSQDRVSVAARTLESRWGDADASGDTPKPALSVSCTLRNAATKASSWLAKSRPRSLAADANVVDVGVVGMRSFLGFQSKKLEPRRRHALSQSPRLNSQQRRFKPTEAAVLKSYRTEAGTSLRRLYCPAFIVQPFLLVCQCAPRCFHPEVGESDLLVFEALGKEGAVLRVITLYISQFHAA